MSSRAKRRKNKRNKESLPLKETQQKNQLTFWQKIEKWSLFWKIVVGILAFSSSVLTVVGTYYAFSPKLTISPSHSLDQTTPLSTKFEIRNDSLFKVKDLKPVCKNVIIKMVGGGGIFNKTGKYAIRNSDPPVPYLDSGESTSFFLPESYVGFGAPIESADVIISVEYRPQFLLFSKEKRARFVTEKALDGTLKWTPKAISE